MLQADKAISADPGQNALPADCSVSVLFALTCFYLIRKLVNAAVKTVVLFSILGDWGVKPWYFSIDTIRVWGCVDKIRVWGAGEG